MPLDKKGEPEINFSLINLKGLATGGCLGNFRWDGGTKRKDLDDSTPTDSAVIIHCLATYLDSQLPAFTDRPDRRPFTGQVKQKKKILLSFFAQNVFRN